MGSHKPDGHISSTADYVVTEQKSRLFPAVLVAACALKHTPVWAQRRNPVDPLPLCENLENLAGQASFFGAEAVNTALDDLLAASVELAGVITEIHTGSRPGFRGAIDQRFQEDYRNALSRFDAAITVFAMTAREALGITGRWRPIVLRTAVLRFGRRVGRGAPS